MVKKCYLVFVSFCALSLNAQTAYETRQVSEPWSNSGITTIVGELLVLLSFDGGFRYQRSDGSKIWSNQDQFANKTIPYDTGQWNVGQKLYAWLGAGNDDSSLPVLAEFTITRVQQNTFLEDADYDIRMEIDDVSLNGGSSLQFNYPDSLEDIEFSTNPNWLSPQLTDSELEQLGLLHGGGSDDNTGGGGSTDDNTNEGNSGGSTGDGNSSSTGLVDTDDDVPMLTQIYERLATLDKDANQYMDTDTNSLISILNELSDTRGNIEQQSRNLGEQVKLSDIEYNTRSLREIRGQIVDENGSREANLADIVNAINGQNVETDFNSTSITTDQEDELRDKANALAENTIQALPNIQNPNADMGIFDWNFGKGISSYNLLDMGTSTGFSLPSVTEAGGFIKKFLTWVVVFIYVFAVKNYVLQVLRDLTKQVDTSPVTNYSVLGNSVGAIAVKASKTVIVLGTITLVLVTLTTATIEGQLMGDTLTGFESLSEFLSVLSGEGHFMSDALTWLAVFVPVYTIFTSVTTFYATKMLVSIEILLMNQFARIAS